MVLKEALKLLFWEERGRMDGIGMEVREGIASM